MKSVAVSELKAKLARFLRIVKSGEIIQIQERGVPIAFLQSSRKEVKLSIIPPRKDPLKLAQMKFTAKPHLDVDIVQFLLEDRKRR